MATQNNRHSPWNIQADQDILSLVSRSVQMQLINESESDNEDPSDKEVSQIFYYT